MRKFDIACHLGFDPLEEVGSRLEELRRLFDAHEVVRAVLLPIGEGYIHRFREQNRSLAQAAAEEPRCLFFAAANPWFGGEALRELEASFRELGAAGVAFDTSRQGLHIDSPMIHPLIELARDHNKPVYFHTGVPLFALPLNLAHLAQRFPEVTFIMGAMGVSDYWGDIVPAVRLCPNIWIETSVNANVPAVLEDFLEEFGDQKVLFGSSYPYTSYAQECRKLERAGIAAASLESIFYRNACRLLGIRP
jgi:predicted TIM-barrel fold metal-dependent hydrolase